MSVPHRDVPGRGCPADALVGEIAHSGPQTRALFTEGLKETLVLLIGRIRAAGNDADNATLRRTAISIYSAMVGAIGVARAVDDPALSEESCVAPRHRLKLWLCHPTSRVQKAPLAKCLNDEFRGGSLDGQHSLRLAKGDFGPKIAACSMSHVLGERRVALVSADVRAREARPTSDHLPLEAAPAESSGRSLEAGEGRAGRAMRSHEGQASPNIWRTMSRSPPM